MSNINNHGVDMNKNTLDQFNFSAVNELNDEVAATCSGGKGYFFSNDPDIILYLDANGKGRSIGVNAKVNDGITNIGFSNGDGTGTPTGFNDRVSSVRVLKGTWNLFQDTNYRGDNTGLLQSGTLYNLGYNNDKISSLKRVA